jgi:hypothetical protein
MLSIRNTFTEETRSIYSNEIQYNNILIGKIETSSKIEYLILFFKITILKNNKKRNNIKDPYNSLFKGV